MANLGTHTRFASDSDDDEEVVAPTFRNEPADSASPAAVVAVYGENDQDSDSDMSSFEPQPLSPASRHTAAAAAAAGSPQSPQSPVSPGGGGGSKQLASSFNNDATPSATPVKAPLSPSPDSEEKSTNGDGKKQLHPSKDQQVVDLISPHSQRQELAANGQRVDATAPRDRPLLHERPHPSHEQILQETLDQAAGHSHSKPPAAIEAEGKSVGNGTEVNAHAPWKEGELVTNQTPAHSQTFAATLPALDEKTVTDPVPASSQSPPSSGNGDDPAASSSSPHTPSCPSPSCSRPLPSMAATTGVRPMCCASRRASTAGAT